MLPSRIELMFDTLTRASQPSDGGRVSVLAASNIGDLQCLLSAALESDSDLDDAQRIDSIRAIEELICTLSAAQARLSRELDESQRETQADAGVPSERRGRGVAAQVAWARRESPHRGQQHLGLAKIVSTELPCTWQAWRTGRITEWKATLIARETACLTLDERHQVDAVIARNPDRLEAMGLGQLAGALAAEAARLDPAAVVRRRRKAEADRHVSLRPAPDTMSWLTALLPVKDGVAAYAALKGSADSARATGDPRSRGQVMADALVGRVVGGTTDEAAATPVALGLVMSDTALLDGADDPAHLDGYGPVPGELAREIVAGALDHDERVGIRRLYTSPTTGELVAMESRSRTFRGNLARFIRLRDRTCRTPWCDAPIRHSDHALGHDDGGSTSLVNGQGLCEACNHAKQARGWQARPSPDGSTVTDLPTGHRYRTRPPVVATIRETPIRIDYVLTC